MSKKYSSSPGGEAFDRAGKNIIEITLTDEVNSSYLAYSYSVIHSRALPDARDGLKPVHRRILFDMAENGLRPDHAYVKSARVVGSAMGRLHPHGDSSIYEALVRLSQDFSINTPVIDGHGNFGSPNDGPAASRYCVTGDTRVRLADYTTMRISDFAAGMLPNSERDISVHVLDKDGKPVHASKVFHSGSHPIKRMSLHGGLSLRGSHNHLVLCLLPIMGVPVFQWIQLDEVRPGMVVAVANNAWSDVTPTKEDRTAAEGVLAEAIRHGGFSENMWRGEVSVRCAVVDAALGLGLLPLAVAEGVQVLALEFGRVLSLHGDGSFGVLRESVDSSVPFVSDFAADEIGYGVLSGKDMVSLQNASLWRRNRSEILQKISDEEVISTILPIMDSGYRFVKVVSVDDEPAEAVYSLRVDSEDHSFLAGGFVNHNTECRLSKVAMGMVGELGEETVDMAPNYDGSLLEPVVLPAAYPYLLVNGASGIAVGMATNMIPHNLGEAIAAARLLLKKPNVGLDELMQVIPGPDLPTGGVLLGLDQVRTAYESGKGSVRIRAKVSVEPLEGSRGRMSIVVTELPYQVGSEKVIEAIKTELGKKRLQGISDVKDLSDRLHGTRLIIECKAGVNPQALLSDLWKFTPLETPFSIANLALVGGQPRMLGLRELLEVFVAHRVDVVTRRTQYRLRKAEARKHIVEGLLIALDNIDEVVRIIRGSKDTSVARAALIKRFKLSEVQAGHILDMPLRRLVGLEVETLRRELAELVEAIAGFNKILNDEKVLRALVDKELAAFASEFASPRRTVLVGGDLQEVLAAEAPALGLEVADDPCEVFLSTSGLLLRTAAESEEVAGGGRKRSGRVRSDTVLSSCRATARGQVLLVTNRARAFKVDVLSLPPVLPTGGTVSLRGGVAASELVPLVSGERVVVVAPLGEELVKGSLGLALGTRFGVVKVCAPDWPLRSGEFEVMGLKPGDEIVGGGWVRDVEREHVVFVSSDAQLLHFPVRGVRPQGRSGGGMAGLKLGEGQVVRAFAVADPSAVGDDAVLVVTYSGVSGKVTPLAEFPSKGRGTGGVRCQRFLKGESEAVLAWVGSQPGAASLKGEPVDLPAVDKRRDASGSVVEGVEVVGRLVQR